MKVLFVLFVFCVLTVNVNTLADLKCKTKLVQAKDEVKEIASRITELQKRLDTWTAQDGLQVYPRLGIAFTAIFTKSLSLGDMQVLKYNKVITNSGNAYNPLTGYFTAPVNGIYSLSVSMMGYHTNGVHLQLVRNGKELVRLWTAGSSRHELASHTINVNLKKGDKIWVQRRKGSGSRIYGDELFNVFSAALLFQNV